MRTPLGSSNPKVRVANGRTRASPRLPGPRTLSAMHAQLLSTEVRKAQTERRLALSLRLDCSAVGPQVAASLAMRWHRQGDRSQAQYLYQPGNEGAQWCGNSTTHPATINKTRILSKPSQGQASRSGAPIRQGPERASPEELGVLLSSTTEPRHPPLLGAGKSSAGKSPPLASGQSPRR